MVRRSLTWAALGILIPLAGIAHPQTGPVIQSTRAMSMPTIDGTATANEWPVAAYPVEFRLPRGTVSGTLRTMWDANTVYLAVDVTHAPFANELDVILDEQANGVLDQGDPAYLAWASGAAQGFHYDARRRGFVQDRRDSGNDFLRASRIQGPTRTFEIAIPYDPYDGEDLNRAPAAWGSMGLALKLEAAGAAGQFDTWPTPGTRDPITRSPHLWSLLTFLPSTTPTLPPLPPPVPPTPAPPTLPTIDLVITPNAPAPLQPVTWRATASSPAGIQQIELLANGGIIRSCALTTICETISGPYTAGTIVRAEARAFDQSGRVATTAWTFTVSTPPVPDTTPPTAPTAVQVINSGTGSALYLFWVNPTDADFSTVRIYRSTTAGSLGSLIATTRTSPYVDTGLAEGTTYSYTFRSVDANGNESANIAQTSGTPRR